VAELPRGDYACQAGIASGRGVEMGIWISRTSIVDVFLDVVANPARFKRAGRLKRLELQEYSTALL
jgi:hypothetical protein